jgi:hypothetical protein
MGFVLSLAQFLYNRSLWMDEAALALDIIHDNSSMLLKGLANGQVAPILYLQIEHLFALLIPKSEYGLRLFPLLCYWASLILFYRVLRCLFSNNFIILFALSLYVFDGVFIYYSSEVKQYMTDVMVVNAMLFFTIKSYRKEKNRYIVLSVAGALAIFLSNISAVILACTGLYIIIGYMRDRKHLWQILGAFFAWAAVFGIYYRCFIYNHPLKQLMLAYWIKAGGFMPLNRHLLAWVADKFVSNFYFQFYFGKAACVLFIILFFTGVIYVIKKRVAVGILLLLPLPLHLLLSGFKLYPFDTRLVLYLTPLLIISVAYGVCWLLQFWPKYDTKPVVRLIIPLILFALLIAQSFPLIRHDALRQCISFMKSRSTKVDDIYITQSAKYPMMFYHDISFYTAQRIIIGSYSPSEISSGKDDLLQLKALSKRVWVYSLKPYHEDTFINKFLVSAGYCASATFTASGNAVVCLYTLKNANKLLLPHTDPSHILAKR